MMSKRREQIAEGLFALDEEMKMRQAAVVASEGLDVEEARARNKVGMFATRGQDDSVGADALPIPARHHTSSVASENEEQFIGAQAVPGVDGVDEEEGSVLYRSVPSLYRTEDASIAPIRAKVVDTNAEIQLALENERLRGERERFRREREQLRHMIENTAVAHVVGEEQGPVDSEMSANAAFGASDRGFRLPCGNRRWLWYVTGVTLLLMAAAGAALGILFKPTPPPPPVSTTPAPSPANTTTITTTPTPTSMTTTTTTRAPTVTPSMQELMDFLSPLSFDGGTALQTPGTPQNDAVIWLSEDASLNTYSQERIVQRYVLATAYYSMNGDGWANNTKWLDGGHECDWWTARTDQAICADDGAFVNLDLTMNNLLGSIPPEIGLLSSSLVLLWLFENLLTGIIPSEIGALTKLTKLELHSNLLTGGIPTEVGRLTSLVLLQLAENNLTGSVPSELGALRKLTKTALDRNSFMETIPTELGLLTNLDWLTLWENELTGSIPSELGDLTKLTLLSLSGNKLTGTVPSTINQLTNLGHLALFDNMLTGSYTCPAYIEDCHVSCGTYDAEECRSLP